MLDTSAASVNSALQRARVTLEGLSLARDHRGLPASRAERAVVERFADAFERGDVDGVVSLLTENAWTRMPSLSRTSTKAGPQSAASWPRARSGRTAGVCAC